MDAKDFIQPLVENKINPMTEEEALSKVNNAITKIDEIMADESEETKAQFLRMKIKNIVSSTNVAKFKGVCVAVGEKRDILDYAKKQAMAAYRENPQRAINSGMVRIEGNDVIPLDTKKFYDAAGTKPNKGYGKKIGTVLRTEAYFILEDEANGNSFAQVSGEFDTAEIGTVYEIFGNMNDNGRINVPREPGIRAVDKLNDSALWDLMMSVAQSNDAAVEIADLSSVAKYALVITTGTVRHQQPTSNGHMLVIEDDSNFDAACFISGPLTELAASVGVGAEVIVIGKATKNIDKRTNEEKTNVFVSGVIVNPSSGKFVNAMKDLDNVFF